MLSSAPAQADNDIYNNTMKYSRGDDALQADVAICDAQLGGAAERRP
jgi:hypothetical protein